MSTAQLRKSGAGLLIVAGDEVLLLLRSSKSGNPNTWGLPGGNADEGETSITTALREASEEMGNTLPNYTIKAEIETIRGKHLDKKFVVFVAEISLEDKSAYTPMLNPEHTAYRWFAMSDILKISNLHPVVKKLFNEHSQELTQALND